MRISREEEAVTLSQLDLFCCELLRQIPLSAEMEDPAVRERLFSSPTAGAEPDFEEDWENYVQPDLRETFQSAIGVVRSDLAGFTSEPMDEELTLRIPVAHLEAWIHGLNQARLAIAATNGFTEKEMEASAPNEGDGRALALFQMHFYGLLLECFLHQADAS